VKDKILDTLRTLRQYALDKGYQVAIYYHEEDSYLMRFANSAISLNTNEHLIRLETTAYEGKKRASYELITDLGKLDEMKASIDTAAEMVGHAMPLTYQPTIPTLSASFIDERGYDPALAQLSNEERLDFFNQAAAGLETGDLKLSGIFSNGANTLAQINTKSEHVQYFKISDAQVTVVLSHETLKWEVIAEQSAGRKSELDPGALNIDLAYLVERYQNDQPQQIPLGSYDIVFGPAATADMVRFMNWIGFNGGLMKRGMSFLNEEKVGQKVFSEKFNLTDDPTRMETFPFKQDFMGIDRKPYPLFLEGVFQGFTWSQDDADEFGAEATGHTVMHNSLSLAPGDQEVSSLRELVEQPRENDILYIPFLHYMNFVNPSQGLVTGTSRFGTLLLKKDGSVIVPYNVRLTQSLLDVFGDKVAWLSKKTVPYNASMSYGARNPTAVIVPNFMRVDDLEISHSNDSY
jgi:predicted Zn-dependent protease